MDYIQQQLVNKTNRSQFIKKPEKETKSYIKNRFNKVEIRIETKEIHALVKKNVP